MATEKFCCMLLGGSLLLLLGAVFFLPSVTTREKLVSPAGGAAVDADAATATAAYLDLVAALTDSGELSSWGDILNKVDAADLPESATLFIPRGRSDLPPPPEHGDLDTSTYYYHVVPQRLTFSELSRFPVGWRIPTLLHFNSIVVTNNSLNNFCIDSVLLTWPDLYSTPSIVIHGIGNLFNHSQYGADYRSSSAAAVFKPWFVF